MANILKSVRVEELFVEKIEELGYGNFSKGLDSLLKDYFMIDSEFNKKKEQLQKQSDRFKEIQDCLVELSTKATVIKNTYY